VTDIEKGTFVTAVTGVTLVTRNRTARGPWGEAFCSGLKFQQIFAACRERVSFDNDKIITP